MTDSIGVAVIGAGMAGRSHAHAYRTAQTVFGTDAPPVRLVAIADVNTDFANHTKDRYGFERTESRWQTIADADDIDAVSIVVANHLHREIAEALLASGKHVLCEKPLASSVEGAEAMVKAADASGLVAACGFSYRQRPLTNEDTATFVAEFANGAAGTFSISRVALGHHNGLGFQVFGYQGRSSLRPFGQRRIRVRRQRIRPRDERLAAGDRRARSPLRCSSAIHALFRHRLRGQEFFTYQARAFLDEIAGLDRLPRQATFADGCETCGLRKPSSRARQLAPR